MVDTAAGGFVGPTCRPHSLGEAPGHCRAQSDSAAVVVVAEPLEWLENEIPLVFGYAWAAVDDSEFDRVCIRARRDQNALTHGGVVQGVGDQVDQHAFQQYRVGQRVG